MFEDLSDEISVERSVHCSGGFGHIYLGSWKSNGSTNPPIVVKVMRESRKRKERTDRQKKLGLKLDNANVLHFRGVYYHQPTSAWGLVYDYCPDGDVNKYLKVNKNADRKQIARDTAKGLSHLHRLGIVHGDLKPSNVLIGPGGIAVLCDFDRSRVIDEDGYTTTTCAFSLRYAAPELLNGGSVDDMERSAPFRVTKEMDVYALGMTMLEIFTGQLPFFYCPPKWEFRLIIPIVQGQRPRRSRYEVAVADVLWSLFECCWHQDAYMRPTSDEVTHTLMLHVG